MTDTTNDDVQTYLYNEIEVVCTGRTATKPSRARGATIQIHEITPKDKEEGSWKRWVPLSTLYVVNG